MFDPPKRSLEQVEQAYTEPSAMLETAEETIKGHPYKVYKNLPPSVGRRFSPPSS